MKTKIIKAGLEYIDDCEKALLNSELGRRYFSKKGNARKVLQKAFYEDDVYVALDENKNCVGFIWFVLNGMFHSFPYLHMIAVKEEYRDLGIGKKLLKFFEDHCFEESSKIFLVVADFNTDAKRLYENMGYREVGSVPNLYRAGITEHVMMKTKQVI